MPRSLRVLVASLGSSASTVRRSSVRSAPMPVSLSIALTGRSRKRLDAPAASAISLRPIAVSWSTFLPNSGLLESSAASSSTNWATRLSSSVVSSVFSGTRPAASAGATGCSASGGSSFSLVAVLRRGVRGFGGHRSILSLPLCGAVREPVNAATRARVQLYYRCKTRRCKAEPELDLVKLTLTMALNGSLTLSG